jgi:hypothetical protein
MNLSSQNLTLEKTMEAQSTNRIPNQIKTAFVLVTLAATQLVAENTLILKKTSEREASIELSNTDPVAGIQFSINARGGIALRSLQSGERTVAAGWEVYPYLRDDSTLNVVMLAPYRSSFTSGKGVIARISFELTNGSTDTGKMFFSSTVLGDPNGQSVSFSAVDLAWTAENSTQDVPTLFSLGQNFPNPFNPSTTLSYKLEKPAKVKLAIYDVVGREIQTLISRYQFQGQYNVKWESVDDAGQKLPSGMYVARLQVENEVATKKMILTK